MTPRDLRTFANLFTSRHSVWYVNTFLSPGSPSQTIAALFRSGVFRWRSRQFSETLILPPTNHFANGSSHWRTLSHRLRQRSCFASSAQKPSKSFIALS